MSSHSTYCFARSATVPIRSGASDAAEMVNQLILGETAEILEQKDRWLGIRTDFDNYEGYVNLSQMEILDEEAYTRWVGDPERGRSPYYRFYIKNDHEVLSVPSGALVRIDGDRVILPSGSYGISDRLKKIKGSDIVETAEGFLGTPYLWGGRTDLGIDCSGLIQTAFALHGYGLPRDSRIQFKLTNSFFTDWKYAQRGDVAYFSTKGDRITHVGFYAGKGLLLHASGNVKFSRIVPGETNKQEFAFEQRLYSGLVGIQSADEIKEYCNPIPYNKATL